MPTDGTCLMCSAPSPEGPCCSTSCLRAATRERDRNLRELRLLRATAGTEDVCAELTRRNGELTGALVAGISAFRPDRTDSMA
ncbi:hypothetical protein [Nitriliruptor alkaliphilus]|uniref:hypothetical protein n=1 Tax=Nitriliruptor alkaliphilus TaxID=427918 RepID=UPI000695EFB9|nr:hypothetical protein [Nitriliruptor alkaliphilus]